MIVDLCVIKLMCALLYKHVDELSEGLVWASQEGCLDDVAFLLSTGVDANSKGQVRLIGQRTRANI